MIRLGAGALAFESDHRTLLAALALSVATGRAFAWKGFRRKAGGLDVAEAAFARWCADLSGGNLLGGSEGDTEVGLEPQSVASGDYRLDVPGAVPALPFLRAALLPLARAGGESKLLVTGATHAAESETFEVTSSTWCVLLGRLGLDVEMKLKCAGFVPGGGGEIASRILGGAAWKAVELVRREELTAVRIVSAGALLPTHVQQRQAARARSGVQISGLTPTVQLLELRAQGGGSVVAVTGVYGTLPVTTSSVSERGKSAEAVGQEAAAGFRRFLNEVGVVPGMFVDSLVLFLAFAKGPSVLTTPRLTQAAMWSTRLAGAFTGRSFEIEGKLGRAARIEIRD